MAFAISRQIKLRSVEQAIFQPSYNRLNFFVQPDGLSTDLSQSYLSARVYLKNAITNQRLSSATMKALIEENLVVSFGNGEQSYSPACLIRVARLFANKGNELLEEVNFANILTQTVMHQLCNDFETLESTNLLTGSTSQIGHGSSLPASLSAFINNPTTVHIMLRDLFGICRHSNFELAETDGLNITIELEDKQNLFRVSTLGDFQKFGVPDISGSTALLAYPEVFVNPAAEGYAQNSDTLAKSGIAHGQFSAPSSDLLIDPSGNTMIQYSKEGWRYGADYWFVQPTIATEITAVVFQHALTADQMTALGFVAGNFMKLKYLISSSYTGAAKVAPREFVYMVPMDTVTAGATPNVAFGNGFSLWWDEIVGKTVDDVVVFDSMEVLAVDEVVGWGGPTTTTTLATTLKSNTINMPLAAYEKLQALGLVDSENRPTAVSFDLAVQMGGAAADATHGSHITPDYIANELSPNVRQIFSNQLTKLPTQGAKCVITNVVGLQDTTVDITYSTLGCESNTSIQGFTIYPQLVGVPIPVPITGSAFFIWNVQNHAMGPNGVTPATPIPSLLNNLSYEIDKFELVLIQSSIDPANRMPRPFIYSTWKLETATIETAQPTYARQFILEENVYNCMLLTPSWNDVAKTRGSLVSTRRGVSYFRYSVNQVNQTNRDVYLSSFRSSYPSTLYLDRMNDTFSNSDYILRSPVGIRGVQESADAVIIYPLKIYHAVSEQAYVMGHPGGATVQLNLFADTASGGKIVPGNIFFFKQILKQLM